MSVYEQLQSAYARIKAGERRINELAAKTSVLIAEAETELSVARADLDSIATSLGYTVPDKLPPGTEYPPEPHFTANHG